jgi:hypothetical protein
MVNRKKIYGDRRGFRLLLETALYSEIEARAKQRFMSMTAYITRALVKWIENERKYE